MTQDGTHPPGSTPAQSPSADDGEANANEQVEAAPSSDSPRAHTPDHAACLQSLVEQALDLELSATSRSPASRDATSHQEETTSPPMPPSNCIIDPPSIPDPPSPANRKRPLPEDASTPFKKRRTPLPTTTTSPPRRRVPPSKQPRECELCGRTLANAENRRRHLRTAHGVVEGLDPPSRRPRECRVCGRVLANAATWRLHVRARHGGWSGEGEGEKGDKKGRERVKKG